jgi:putative ABC transport system substrate-binding protein
MAERGWVDGKTVAFRHRFMNDRYEVPDALASEVLSEGPGVVLVPSDIAAFALQRRTTTVPIVIAVSADPVETGLAASLARPGGNVTGPTPVLPTRSSPSASRSCAR